MESWAFPLAALIISMTTLVLGALALNHKADNARLNDAIREIDGLKTELRRCQEERSAAERKERDALRQLAEYNAKN